MMNTRLNAWVLRIVSYLIGIGLLIALILYAGFDRFWQIIRHISLPWIGVSLLVYACSWLFRTWRLQRFTGQTIRLPDLFKLHISGYALNTLLPAKLGDAATIGFLKMRGIKIGRAAAIILQTRILDLLALILLAIPSLLFLLQRSTPAWMVSSILLCILVVCLPMAIVNLDRRQTLSLILDKQEKRFSNKWFRLFLSKLKDAYAAYHEIVADKKLLFLSSALSLVIWLFDGLTCYALSLAVAAQISPFPIILAVSIANIGKSVPVTPGSVGIYEGIMAAVLVLFNLPHDTAVAIAILDHALKKLFNLTLGLPATTNIGLDITQIRKVPEKSTKKETVKEA